jgi:hypothetical protein
MDWEHSMVSKRFMAGTIRCGSLPGLFLLLNVVLLVCAILVLSCADIRILIAHTPDDGAYFLKIAQHVAAGDGLTFDGVNSTNGFQPLWQYLVILMYLVHSGEPETMYRAAFIVQACLLVAAALVLHSVLIRLFDCRVAFVTGVASVFFVSSTALNGMESAVLVLTMVLLLASAVTNWERAWLDPRRALGFGIVLGTVILSRLDTIFLASVVYGVALLGAMTAPTRRPRVFAWLAAVFGTLIVVTPYLIFNYLRFGAAMPISGALKCTFPRVELFPLPMVVNKVNVVLVSVAVAYMIWIAARAWRRGYGSRRIWWFRVSLGCLGAAVIIHYIHTLLFMKWAVFPWHFASYWVFFSVVIAEPVALFLSRRWMDRASGARLAIALGVVGCAGARYVLKGYGVIGPWHTASYEAALWARSRTNVDSVFAMSDAGRFGFFSKRAVINLDGVVNGRELQEVLRTGHLERYLMEKGVGYIVQHNIARRSTIEVIGGPDAVHGPYEAVRIRYPSHLFPGSSDTVLVRSADEVYRSTPYYDGEQTPFVIWKWEPVRIVRR